MVKSGRKQRRQALQARVAGANLGVKLEQLQDSLKPAGQPYCGSAGDRLASPAQDWASLVGQEQQVGGFKQCMEGTMQSYMQPVPPGAVAACSW